MTSQMSGTGIMKPPRHYHHPGGRILDQTGTGSNTVFEELGDATIVIAMSNYQPSPKRILQSPSASSEFVKGRGELDSRFENVWLGSSVL